MTKEYSPINIDLIDQLLKNYNSPEDVLGENGLGGNAQKVTCSNAWKVDHPFS